MLRGKSDFFRETILISILFHYILSLYDFSICLSSDIDGITNIVILGSFILDLIMTYLLQFFLWIPIRSGRYVEGKENYFLLWTILLAIWSIGFRFFMNNDFMRIIISGVILLIIYFLIRYKIGTYSEEESTKREQLKEDVVSILFLAISQLFLRGVLIFVTNIKGLNVFLLIVEIFVVSEMIVCYLNCRLYKKFFSILNAILIGGFGFILLIKVFNVEQNNNLLNVGCVCGLVLGWCFCISQINKCFKIQTSYQR